MNFQPIERMQPGEIVAEIAALSRELQPKLARIHHLSDGLYQRVRRAPADDHTALFMRYASSWARFAGMASQGIRRASTGDKALRSVTPPANPPQSFVKPVLKHAPAATTPVEALLDMYSEESATGTE
jgi:hypothetical protein